MVRVHIARFSHRVREWLTVRRADNKAAPSPTVTWRQSPIIRKIRHASRLNYSRTRILVARLRHRIRVQMQRPWRVERIGTFHLVAMRRNEQAWRLMVGCIADRSSAVRERHAADFGVSPPHRKLAICLIDRPMARSLKTEYANLAPDDVPVGWYSSLTRSINIIPTESMSIEDIFTHEYVHACLDAWPQPAALPSALNEGYSVHVESLLSQCSSHGRTDNQLHGHYLNWITHRAPFAPAELCALKRETVRGFDYEKSLVFCAQGMLLVRFLLDLALSEATPRQALAAVHRAGVRNHPKAVGEDCPTSRRRTGQLGREVRAILPNTPRLGHLADIRLTCDIRAARR